MGELSYPSAGMATSIRARLDGAAAFALTGTGVLALGAAHGGYFPTAWGWAVLASVALLVWSLSVRRIVSPTAAEGLFLGGFLALGCWFALSAAWGTTASSFDEAFRVLVYVTGAAAALSVVRRGSAAATVAGVLAGTSALALYALASRLFPDRIGTFDSVAVYRLSTPIGYWNALGLLCALGVLLAVGLAASTSSPARAAFAAAPVPILLTTLYFTFSRGSWIALGIGLAVTLFCATAVAQKSFRTAIGRDSGDWNLWLDLAHASTGKTQATAITHVSRLDPLNAELAEFESELGLQGGISITAGGSG